MSLARGVGIAGSLREPLSPHPARVCCTVVLRIASFGKGAAARDERMSINLLRVKRQKKSNLAVHGQERGFGRGGRVCLPPTLTPFLPPVGLESLLPQGL